MNVFFLFPGLTYYDGKKLTQSYRLLLSRYVAISWIFFLKNSVRIHWKAIWLVVFKCSGHLLACLLNGVAWLNLSLTSLVCLSWCSRIKSRDVSGNILPNQRSRVLAPAEFVCLFVYLFFRSSLDLFSLPLPVFHTCGSDSQLTQNALRADYASLKMSLEDSDLLYRLYLKKHVPEDFTYMKWKELAYW